MKVYKCIKKSDYTQNVILMGIQIFESANIDDLYVEPKGKNYEYLEWKDGEEKIEWQSYVGTTGYPKSRDFIENNPDKFKLLFDDTEHDTSFYIHKKYTEYNMEDVLNKIKEWAKYNITGSADFSTLKDFINA